MLGNMKFVGQLLINKVLSTKVLFACTSALLIEPSDEKLETLCAFLMTIGPAFDVEYFKHHKELAKVFQEVRDLSTTTSKEHAHIQQRTKFLLKDICELRATSWGSKRPNNEPTGPMRMADVKGQWEQDNKQGDRKGAALGGRGAPAPLQDADDEWATVGAARKGVAKQTSTPQGRSTPMRPATTANATTASNPFGIFEKKGKDKKERKDADWRRGETPEKESSGRSEWKPRPRQAGEIERQLSTDSCPAFVKGVSSTSQVTEERSEADVRKEMKLTIGELASSHDLSEALARIEASKIPPSHQKAVIVEMLSQISQRRESDRPCLISFLIALAGVGGEEPRKNIFQRSVLLEGLTRFVEEIYSDLKCDVPRLPNILREEFFPALGKDALSAEEIATLEQKLKDTDANDA
jgi:hypothetical protein